MRINELRDQLSNLGELKRLFLIHDNDPTHTAHQIKSYFDTHPIWRPRFTPVKASWLNQAEIGINLFSHRYLKRRSWTHRDEFIRHVIASNVEYNRFYAHPIEWTWTNAKMRRWFQKHSS